MTVLGITGGVATGKSSLARQLGLRLGAEVFDSDACVRELMGEEAVRAELREAFGEEVINPAGEVDRQFLRERVFRDSRQKERLERILHPRVRLRWTEAIRSSRMLVASRYLLVEVPLLYEVGAEKEFDAIVVVACSDRQQMERLCAGRGLSEEIARRMVEAQWSLAEKILRASHLVWSGGTRALFERQVESLAGLLERAYV